MLCHERFVAECPHLQSLPPYRYADYELLSVKVTTRSTITVRCITYTVPSRLIAQQLTVHLYHDRLEGFVGRVQVVSLPRIYVPKNSPKRRGRSVNYRHVIDSLRLKPRAFLHCTWQQELLPSEDYRQLWQLLRAQLDPYSAARLMTEALYIAAKQDKESAVAHYLSTHLQEQNLTLAGLQQYFQLTSDLALPLLEVHQHHLIQYDSLIAHDTHYHPHQPNSQQPAQGPQAAPYAPAMAGPGAPGSPAKLDPCPVLTGAV